MKLIYAPKGQIEIEKVTKSNNHKVRLYVLEFKERIKHYLSGTKLRIKFIPFVIIILNGMFKITFR